MPKLKNILPEEAIQARATRLRNARKIARISRKQLCEGTDYKEDTVYRWEKGRYLGTNETAAAAFSQRLREFGLICSPEWLLHGEGVAPYKSLTETESDLSYPDSSANTAQQDLNLFRQTHRNVISVQITDTSMAPQFQPGDYVAGFKLNRFDNLIVGNICIVQLEATGALLLRRVEKGSQQHLYTLLCNNTIEGHPIAMQDVKLVLATPVIWWRRPLEIVMSQEVMLV